MRKEAEIMQAVRQAATESLSREIDITSDMPLQELGDSLDLVDIIMIVEDRLGVRIWQERHQHNKPDYGIRTVGDMVHAFRMAR